MKRILSFVIIILVVSNLKSQSYTSIFGSDSTQWNITIGNLWGMDTDFHTVIGDAMIDGKEYKKIGGYSIIDFYGYLREDQSHTKAWYRNNQDTAEYLVMDLSLNIGDSMYIGGNWNSKPGYYHVDSIYEIDDKRHLRFDKQIPYFNGIDTFTMIEGVVSNMGFRFQDEAYKNNFNPYLLCSYKNTEQIFGGNLCHFIAGIEPLERKVLIVSLFPNPASDFLYISFEEGFTGNIEIFTLDGKKVLTKRIIHEISKRIDLNRLKIGTYVVKIIGDKHILTKKIVILE